MPKKKSLKKILQKGSQIKKITIKRIRMKHKINK
jgi:hypothetical protein